MTFGIDVSGQQRGIDLVRAKAEGVEFVVVKASGLNVTPQYVAEQYTQHVDAAITAGLPRGHYYLIGGGQTPEQQADYFVGNLYRFDSAHDVLALDNERLNSNGTFWGDSEAARFVKRVLERTSIPASRFWHYASAADYRAVGSWPQLAALGVRFWWAAYGDYPTGQTPDHEPDLQGSIPAWDVHQYSSRVTVAGFTVDGNYSPHSVATLFGDAAPVITDGGTDMAILIKSPNRVWRLLFDSGRDRIVSDSHAVVMKTAVAKVIETNDAAYDIIKANYTQGLPIPAPVVVADASVAAIASASVSELGRSIAG